jgi:hypothetical protein
VDKGSYLEHKELELLTAITEEKVKDASLRDICTSFGIISDKRRLEQGLANQHMALNISLQVVSDEPNQVDLGEISAHIMGNVPGNEDSDNV